MAKSYDLVFQQLRLLALPKLYFLLITPWTGETEDSISLVDLQDSISLVDLLVFISLCVLVIAEEILQRT